MSALLYLTFDVNLKSSVDVCLVVLGDDLIFVPSCPPYHSLLNSKWPSQQCVEHAH